MALRRVRRRRGSFGRALVRRPHRGARAACGVARELCRRRHRRHRVRARRRRHRQVAPHWRTAQPCARRRLRLPHRARAGLRHGQGPRGGPRNRRQPVAPAAGRGRCRADRVAAAAVHAPSRACEGGAFPARRRRLAAVGGSRGPVRGDGQCDTATRPGRGCRQAARGDVHGVAGAPDRRGLALGGQGDARSRRRAHARGRDAARRPRPHVARRRRSAHRRVAGIGARQSAPHDRPRSARGEGCARLRRRLPVGADRICAQMRRTLGWQSALPRAADACRRREGRRAPGVAFQPRARADGPAAGTGPRGVAGSSGRRPALSARTGARAGTDAGLFLRCVDGALPGRARRRRIPVRARAHPRRRLCLAHPRPPRRAAPRSREMVRRARSGARRRAPRPRRSARGAAGVSRRCPGPVRGARARARARAGRARHRLGQAARGPRRAQHAARPIAL